MREALSPMKALDAADLLRPAAPTGRVEFKAGDGAGGVPAEHAQTHDSDAPLPGCRTVNILPDAGAVLSFDFRNAPMEAQYMEQHVFGHAFGQAMIDHAHHGNMLRQLRIGEDVLDARPKRETRLQIRIALEVTLDRMPDQREVDIAGISDVGPLAKIEFRIGLGECAAPQVGAVGFALEQKRHGHSQVLTVCVSTVSSAKAAAIKALV